jgi:hypothetical protein
MEKLKLKNISNHIITRSQECRNSILIKIDKEVIEEVEKKVDNSEDQTIEIIRAHQVDYNITIVTNQWNKRPRKN